MDITDPAAVREAFVDIALIPPPAGPGAAFRLRSQVARFSSGDDHERRRALAIAEIAAIDPQHAARLAAERIHQGDSVRQAIIKAFSLVPDEAVDLVLKVTPSYFDSGHHAADEPLAQLWELLGPADEEVIAAKLGLLMQACDATARLVEHGLVAPPRATARVATRDTTIAGAPVPAGATVSLDLTELPFGAPPRECPGQDLAVAIATAIVAELGVQS